MAVTTSFGWNFDVFPASFVNNGYTAGNQTQVAAAANPAGTQFQVTWTDPNFSPSIEGRLWGSGATLGNGGGPLNNEFTVNSTTLNNQTDSSVAGLLNGNFVTTFTDDSSGTEHVRARIVQPTVSTQVTPTFLGNDFLADGGSGNSRDSDVAVLANGNWVVSYTRDFGGNDNNIRFDIFTPTGTEVTSGFQDANNSVALNTNHSSVAGLAGGGFVVAWQQNPVGGGNNLVAFRLFDSAGAATSGTSLPARPSTISATTPIFRPSASSTAASRSPIRITAG